MHPGTILTESQRGERPHHGTKEFPEIPTPEGLTQEKSLSYNIIRYK